MGQKKSPVVLTVSKGNSWADQSENQPYVTNIAQNLCRVWLWGENKSFFSVRVFVEGPNFGCFGSFLAIYGGR